jgi:heavy metal efflux system protein
VSSAVGFIGLFGIAVQNGLVLIAQTRTLMAEVTPFSEALRTASIGRVRPKLMTAGCAMLGLLPLVLSRTQGGELERPLAIVMIGGLVTSTLFTLLALPTFYSLVERDGELAEVASSTRPRLASVQFLCDPNSEPLWPVAHSDPVSTREMRDE